MAFWKTLFNLRRGEDKKENVLRNIKSNISFIGANLWILACAIVIASVGLNVNSTAVIIGAMLISPLMGPIVGAGFALGMYDFPLLKRSVSNLLIATVAGLIVSTVYFFFTPFKDAQSEILARTAPNIYDVLIAFFGGLVGVIAVTRVEKGNPIPGVAIATALMPPLCTAGFGIATGNWAFFGGAIFLYTINCIFICVATYIIVKILKYPEVAIAPKREKRVHLLITVLVVLIIAPSIYFAYIFLKEQQFKKNISVFISKEFEEKGDMVIYKKSNYNTNPKTIELAFLIKKFNGDEIKLLSKKLPDYKLPNTRLIIRQDSSFLAENKTIMEPDNERVRSEQNVIDKLKNELDNYKVYTPNIYPEANSIFPSISSLSIAKLRVYDASDSLHYMPVVVYETSKVLSKEDEQRLYKWLRIKLSFDTLLLYKN